MGGRDPHRDARGDVPATTRGGDDATVQTTLLLLTAVGAIILLAGVASSVGVLPAKLDSDSDGDGLVDARERAIGTDPDDPDTDGDRILDGWEVAGETPGGAKLPDADPLRKDLYLQVDYGETVRPFSAAERRQIRGTFARMNVSNADGSEGIRVHVVDEAPRGGNLGRTVEIDGTRKREAYVEEFYTDDRLGPRKCVYHLVVLGQVHDGRTAGLGDSPGYLSMVDGRDTLRRGGDVTARVRYLVHEVLHNVVGQFPDGSYHTSRGWLTHVAVFAGENEFLSNATERKLSQDGFATSSYYGGSVC